MTSVRATDEKVLEFLKSEKGKKIVQDIYNDDKDLQLSDNNLDNNNEINDLAKLHMFILNKPTLLNLLMKQAAIQLEDIIEDNKYTHKFTEFEIEELSKHMKNLPEELYVWYFISDILSELFVFDTKPLSTAKPGIDHSGDSNLIPKIVGAATELILNAFEENKAISIETIQDFITHMYNNLKLKPISSSFTKIDISESFLEMFADNYINIWKNRLENLEKLKIKENPIDRAVYGTKDFVKKGVKKVGNVGKVVSESKVVNDVIDSPIGAPLLFITIVSVIVFIVWIVSLFFD